MKCNCIKEMVAKIKEMKPELEDIAAPMELITGRVYLNFTATKIIRGKKKETNVPVLLSKCPFCGMKQTNESGDNND